MKLLNVRLGPEDSRIAGELRKQGIQLSGIVREALRAAYGARKRRREPRRRASEIMAEIYAEIPDPPGLPKPGYDLRDRRSMRRAIRARVRQPRP